MMTSRVALMLFPICTMVFKDDAISLSKPEAANCESPFPMSFLDLFSASFKMFAIELCALCGLDGLSGLGGISAATDSVAVSVCA